MVAKRSLVNTSNIFNVGCQVILAPECTVQSSYKSHSEDSLEVLEIFYFPLSLWTATWNVDKPFHSLIGVVQFGPYNSLTV